MSSWHGARMDGQFDVNERRRDSDAITGDNQKETEGIFGAKQRSRGIDAERREDTRDRIYFDSGLEQVGGDWPYMIFDLFGFDR